MHWHGCMKRSRVEYLTAHQDGDTSTCASIGLRSLGSRVYSGLVHGRICMCVVRLQKLTATKVKFIECSLKQYHKSFWLPMDFNTVDIYLSSP